MRSFVFKFLPVICASMLLLSACAKDEPEPQEPATPPVVNADPPYFRWTTSVADFTEADSAHAYVNSNVIFAFKNNTGKSMEVRLSSMNTGTYAISSSSGNQLEYQTGSTIYTGNGTFNITESSTSSLSGKFDCKLSGGVLSAISGSFVGIQKRYN
jgi:hypothetical protein